MAGFGLINMNGRVYDPYLQRFLSPDPIVQEPGNAQNFNRYSYVLNNPLMNIDPTGFSTLDYQEGIANMSFSLPGSGIDHGWDYGTQPTTGNTFGRWSLYSHNWQNPYSGLNNSYHYNNGTYYNGYGEVVPFSRVHNYIDYKLGLGKWVTFNRWSEKGKGGYYLGELTSMAVWVLRGRDPMNESQEVEPSTSDYLEFFARISLGMTPDAISISGDIDVYAGGGTSASVAGFLIMLKGKNPGSYTLYSDVGAGGGIPGASAMITLTKYYFVGVDLNDIIIESIEDRRTNIGFSLGEGVVVGAGITSMVAPNGGYIFGVSYSIGFGGGFPVSVNINGGNTFFWP